MKNILWKKTAEEEGHPRREKRVPPKEFRKTRETPAKEEEGRRRDQALVRTRFSGTKGDEGPKSLSILHRKKRLRELKSYRTEEASQGVFLTRSSRVLHKGTKMRKALLPEVCG